MTWHSEARRYQIRGSWSVNESKRVSSRPTAGNETIEFPSWTREFPVPRVYDDPCGGQSFREKARSTRHRLELLASFCLIPGLWRNRLQKRDSSEIFSQDETESFRKWDLVFLLFRNYNFIYTKFQASIFIMYYKIVIMGKKFRSLFLLLDRIKKFIITRFNPNSFSC